MEMDKKSHADLQWHLVLGTSLIQIATDAFNRYQEVTGGVPDQATTLLKITPAQYANLKSVFFNVNGVCVLSWVGHWQCGVISLPFSPGSIWINP